MGNGNMEYKVCQYNYVVVFEWAVEKRSNGRGCAATEIEDSNCKAGVAGDGEFGWRDKLTATGAAGLVLADGMGRDWRSEVKMVGARSCETE